MSSWPRPHDDAEDELKAADMLLDKADALLRRHRGNDPEPEHEVFISLEDDDLPLLTEVVDPSELLATPEPEPLIAAQTPAPVSPPLPADAPAPAASPAPASPPVPASSEPPQAPASATPTFAPRAPVAPPAASPPTPPPAASHSQPVSQLAEQLISLDTEIARAVEAWFATELPQLLTRELDKLSSRLQEEATAHLRATLLPTLSEHISRSLEKNTDITD